ncbi:MAG: hypothetical protein R3290_08170 [Acidimicrobiia bacterium]|nr:hypothetical protein [Acidimicrobiia bacterium]
MRTRLALATIVAVVMTLLPAAAVAAPPGCKVDCPGGQRPTIFRTVMPGDNILIDITGAGLLAKWVRVMPGDNILIDITGAGFRGVHVSKVMPGDNAD